MKNNSFFQISINAQKLNQFLQEFKKLLNSQEVRTEQINRKITGKICQINDKIQKIENQLKINQSQTKKSLLNQVLILKDSIKKSQDKVTNLVDIIQTKLSCINVNLLQQKERTSIIENKTQYAFQQCKQIKNLKAKLSSFEKDLAQIKTDTFKSVIQEYLGKAQQEKINEICQQNFFRILENDRVQEMLFKIPSMKGTEQNSSSRRNHKRSLTEKDAMFYASISDKLDKLEKKLVDKGPENINKILYPSKTVQRWENESQKDPGRKSIIKQTGEEEKQQNVTVKNITSRLENIQTIITSKVIELKKELLRQLDKSEVMNEKLTILNKRVQKEKIRINDLTAQFKKYTQKKFDQKIVQNFRYEIRQKTIDYQDSLDLKINKDMFEKQRTRTNQRIKIIHQNLTQKADKVQIKKAVLFLQQKIKQIIFLIAGSYDEDRDGSAKKSNFKCLSCDKQLQNKLINIKQRFKENLNERVKQNEIKQLTQRKSESNLKLRCTTSRVRKNIRLTSGSTINSGVSGLTTGVSTPVTFSVNPIHLD